MGGSPAAVMLPTRVVIVGTTPDGRGTTMMLLSAPRETNLEQMATQGDVITESEVAAWFPAGWPKPDAIGLQMLTNDLNTMRVTTPLGELLRQFEGRPLDRVKAAVRTLTAELPPMLAAQAQGLAAAGHAGTEPPISAEDHHAWRTLLTLATRIDASFLQPLRRHRDAPWHDDAAMIASIIEGMGKRLGIERVSFAKPDSPAIGIIQCALARAYPIHVTPHAIVMALRRRKAETPPIIDMQVTRTTPRQEQV